MSSNTFKQKFTVSIKERRMLNNHNSFLLLFTGLSGSGKSTIANALEQKLFNENIKTFTLDGDNIRKGINSDLEFTEKDRKENIRRIAHISDLFINAGIVVLASFIVPFVKDREYIKSIVKSTNFVEIYINTPLAECEKRDIKGLYLKARKGEIKNFTGISSPYQEPDNPDIEIETLKSSVNEAVEFIYNTIKIKLNLHNE